MRVAVLAVIVTATVGCSRSFETYFASGERHLEAGKYPQAVIQFQNAARRDPQSPAVHVKLGAAYTALGDSQNAAAAYTRACALYEQDANVCVQAATILLALGDHARAAAQAELALGIDPRNADAELILGKGLAAMGRLGEAEKHLRAAAAWQSARAYHALGELQLRRGNSIDAESSLLKAIDLDASAPAPRISLARAYLTVGRSGDAARQMRAALAVQPLDLAANRAYADYLVENDRCADAEPYWKNVATHSPDGSGTLALADYYVFAGRADDALRVLAPLMAQDQDRAAASTRAASIAYDEGDRDKATALVDEVLTRDPSNLNGLLVKARIAVDEQDAALAREYAHRAAMIAPDAPAVRQLMTQLSALDDRRQRR